jgi:flagellar protein FlaG
MHPEVFMTSPVTEASVATRVAAAEPAERRERPREARDGASLRAQGPTDGSDAQQDPGAVEAMAATFDRGPQVVLTEGKEIEFSFDRHSNRIVVRVTSGDGDKVIRQIPPEQYLRFRDRLSEMVGVLFDERS